MSRKKTVIIKRTPREDKNRYVIEVWEGSGDKNKRIVSRIFADVVLYFDSVVYEESIRGLEVPAGRQAD